jgi:hypothetical protein
VGSAGDREQCHPHLLGQEQLQAVCTTIACCHSPSLFWRVCWRPASLPEPGHGSLCHLQHGPAPGRVGLPDAGKPISTCSTRHLIQIRWRVLAAFSGMPHFHSFLDFLCTFSLGKRNRGLEVWTILLQAYQQKVEMEVQGKVLGQARGAATSATDVLPALSNPNQAGLFDRSSVLHGPARMCLPLMKFLPAKAEVVPQYQCVGVA